MKKIVLLLLLNLCLIHITSAQRANVIDHELYELINSRSTDKISVNIILKSQPNLEESDVRSKFSDKQSKREYILRELKLFSEKNQADILSTLQVSERGSQVSDIKCHWLANMINCNATADVIYKLAEHPDVAAIRYNKLQYMLFDEKAEKTSAVRGNVENVTKIKADNVWDLGFTGEGITVAVLDTGVNTDHVDLKDHLWDGGSAYPNHGYNTLENSHDITDRDGHGTHCAGTICGDGTSGTHSGMAPDATLMVVKILGDDGKGSIDAIISGVEFAVEHGADVLSLSVGFAYPSNDASVYTIMRETFENTLEMDIVASVAAGNDGDDLAGFPIPQNTNAPGCCPPPWIHPDQQANSGGLTSVICVGAVDYYDVSCVFSSEGPVTWTGTEWKDYPLTFDIAPNWLRYDNNVYSASIGGIDKFSWAVMFPPSKQQDFTEGELTKISIFDGTYETTSGTFDIYSGGETPASGTKIHSQSYTLTGTKTFVEFDLSTTVTVNSTKNLWIVFNTDDGNTAYPASGCMRTEDPNGCWIGIGGQWYDNANVGLDNTWMIRAYITNYTGGAPVVAENEFGLIRPDVSAPGLDIVSCAHDSNKGFATLSGTSMATPCVAGAMALLLDKDPNLTPAQICEVLETTAVKLSNAKNNRTGSGRIDVLAAINALGGEGSGRPDIKFVSCTPDDIKTGKNIQITITLVNEGNAPTEDNFTLELMSDDEYITIVDNTFNFGQIEPDETVTGTFTINASTSTPNGHVIDFTLINDNVVLTKTSKTYTFDNDLDGWTTINANNDDHTWYHSSLASQHDARNNGYIISESFCNASGTVISPDDYVVSPFKVLVGDDTSVEFLAQAQDSNYPNEVFGIAISNTGNTSDTDFATINQWTMKAKSAGTIYRCSLELGEYSGQELWIALRHFNCEDQFRLNVDDFSINNYLSPKDESWNTSFSITVSNECIAPSKLKDKTVTQNSIYMTWNASSTSKKYEVYRNGVKIAETNNTSYTDEQLEADTEYCYIVKGICNLGLSDPTNEICVTTEKAEIPDDALTEYPNLFNIYPNPADNNIIIETDERITEICIFNIVGVMVYRDADPNDNSIDISEFNSGAYFIKITTDNGEVIKHIIKK